MSSANDKQVDGSHYQAQFQHWDWVVYNSIGYIEGCATKYVARNRKKYPDPTIDLTKALHYIEKLRELFLLGVAKPRNRFALWLYRLTHRNIPPLTLICWGRQLAVSVEEFGEANDLTPDEMMVCTLLAFWGDETDLDAAHGIVEALIAQAGANSEEHF